MGNGIFGKVKVDKLYKMGEGREDKITKLPKNRYIYDGCFLLKREKTGEWMAESIDNGVFICDGDSLSHLLDNLETRLDPDWSPGAGLPL